MKGWVTFTHHVSQEKLHIQIKNISGIREAQKANLLLMKGTNGMYISESVDQIFELIRLGEEE